MTHTRVSNDFWKEEAIFDSSPELLGPNRDFLRAEPIGSYTDAGMTITSSSDNFYNLNIRSFL